LSGEIKSVSIKNMERKELIRTIYLYLFSLVGLVLIVIGTVRLIDLGLKTWIFTKADQVVVYPEYPRAIKPGVDSAATETELTPEQQEKYKQEQLVYQEKERDSRRQRTAANSIALMIVGVPLFAYHWRVIQRAKEERKA